MVSSIALTSWLKVHISFLCHTCKHYWKACFSSDFSGLYIAVDVFRWFKIIPFQEHDKVTRDQRRWLKWMYQHWCLYFVKQRFTKSEVLNKPCYDAIFICAPKYFILLDEFQDITIQNLKSEWMLNCLLWRNFNIHAPFCRLKTEFFPLETGVYFCVLYKNQVQLSTT